MENRLADKFAVVTGGGRGIGRQIATALVNSGARVAITGRDETRLREAASAVGEPCKAYPCDQTDPDAVKAVAERIVSEIGDPDILVCNAGVMRGGSVVDLALETWNQVIGTNLTGTFLTIQAFLPSMIKKNRGDIFIISSMSGKKGDPGSAAYCASKFGLQGLAQSLLYEVRGNNIRVMVLNPSSVDTRIRQGLNHGKGAHLHAADIAATVAHMACLPGRTLIRDMDIWGTNP